MVQLVHRYWIGKVLFSSAYRQQKDAALTFIHQNSRSLQQISDALPTVVQMYRTLKILPVKQHRVSCPDQFVIGDSNFYHIAIGC